MLSRINLPAKLPYKHIIKFVTGIPLLSALQTIAQQYFLLEELYEIGPRSLIRPWWPYYN